MKKAVVIPSLLCAVVVLFGFSYFAEQLAGEHQETVAVRNSAFEFEHILLTALAINWDPNELRVRAHPLLRSAIEASGSNMEADFAKLRQLGPLKKENCTLANLAISHDEIDRCTIAEFTCNAEYATQNASILLQIRQDHLKSGWMVSTFSITPVN